MLDGINLNIAASFASTIATNVTTGVSYGKELYGAISPAYSDFLLYRYGTEIMNSQGANLSAMGNFALTILAMPGVQENLTKAIQIPTGIDESLIQTYLNGALTCLSVAATVLPMVSSYLTPTKETQKSIEKIKESVKEIEVDFKHQKSGPKTQTTSEKAQTSQTPDKRKKLLTQYPQSQKKPHSKRQHKHKHSHHHKHKPKN